MLNDIYYGFQCILKSNEPVRFTNTYHGMPVSYSGRILSFEGGQVLFNVPRIQIVCIRPTRITYLRSNLLPSTLKAHALTWDLREEVITLERFERSSDTIGSRSLVRVEPRQHFRAVLVPNNDKITYGVTITELSLSGMTAIISSQAYREKDLGKGERVFLVFPLPPLIQTAAAKPEMVSCKGLIRNVIQQENLTHRLGIQIFPTANNAQAMTRYIANRQAELLKELRRLSTEDLLI